MNDCARARWEMRCDAGGALGGRFRGRATGYTRRDGFARRRVHRSEFFTIYSRGSIGTFAVARDERAGSVDGIGFTHTPTRNGGSVVRWTSHRSFGRRDAYTRCATGRSESPEIVSIPFVAFRRRCSSRARSRPVATPTWTHSTTRERHGRTRAWNGKPAGNRDSDVWDRFGGSQLENVPPLP